jgi:hypothetical protein
MNWLRHIIKGSSKIADVNPNDDKIDFRISESVAGIRFNFTAMQARYSCREDPAPTEYDLSRDTDGHWQIRQRKPVSEINEWVSWAIEFPVWADKEQVIEDAYQKFCASSTDDH